MKRAVRKEGKVSRLYQEAVLQQQVNTLFLESLSEKQS